MSFNSTISADLALDRGTATQLYRIVQEALNNALRHAAPLTIELALAHEATAVLLTIRDDGIGMPSADRFTPGVGLRGMRYRAATIGATVTIGRSHPAGTVVEVRLPLNCAFDAACESH